MLPGEALVEIDLVALQQARISQGRGEGEKRAPETLPEDRGVTRAAMAGLASAMLLAAHGCAPAALPEEP